MSMKSSLQKRRSYYNINKELPVEQRKIVNEIEELTELVPDAFNMKSSYVAIVLGKRHDLLWDIIYEAFNGAVPREKINSFASGAGTILYFYDQKIIEEHQKSFPLYANNFPIWAMQSSGMLQLSIWSGLRELGIGASLQHYNPIIDEKVRTFLNLSENYILVAQMPFGGIVEEPKAKEDEDISKRLKVYSN